MPTRKERNLTESHTHTHTTSNLTGLLPSPSFLHPRDHLTCGFDFGPPAAGPAGSVEAQVSCGTGPSLTGPGQVGLKGSPHSQEVPWKVPEVSFGYLATYLVSTEGRGPRDVTLSLLAPPRKEKW